MRDLDPLAPSSDACVTASDFVRQFGLWQERAMQQPVFVLRRGRASLVLTSVDLMRRVCAPHDTGQGAPLCDLLLDAMREIMLVADLGGRVDQMNRAARIAFGGDLAGHPLSRLMPDTAARYLTELIARAHRAGSAEQAELSMRDRRYRFAVIPVGEGAILLAEDISGEEDAARAAAGLGAIHDGLSLLGEAAWARINLRGYIEETSEALSRLTGIESDTLQSVRFVTLLDIDSRSAVGDAIEAVMADFQPRRLDVALHLRDGGTRPARLALAAERIRMRVEHVTAVLLVT